jgi:hypothetical protein
MLRFERGVTRRIEVDWYHRVEPELTLPRPRGYVLLPGWPEVAGLLEAHGLTLEPVPEAEERRPELDVETIRVADPVLATAPYQGAVMVESFSVKRRIEHRPLPPGCLWIPADQPLIELAVQLLEPEAPDSVLRWGMLSSVFERREYVDMETLEAFARERLAEEGSSLAADWEAALADASLASDPAARYLWWYRHSPYWDELVGLLPVLRLLDAPPWATAGPDDTERDGG